MTTDPASTLAPAHLAATSLADRPLGSAVRVIAVAWDQLESGEARRLRALGIDVGAVLKLAHRGIFAGRDPIAVEVGRMTVALRRGHALAIIVEDAPGEHVHPAAAPNAAPGTATVTATTTATAVHSA